mgnify:FL=1
MQLQAARETIAMLNKQYETTRSDLAPQRQTGYEALAKQSNLLGLPGYVPNAEGTLTTVNPTGTVSEMFQKSPSYQFLMDEGTRAINTRNAATGSFYSGKPMRELARYSAGLASTEFEKYFSQLGALSGMGQNAINTTTQAGSTTAANSGTALMSGYSDYGSALMQAGASRASGIVGQSNAIKGTIKDAAMAFAVCWVAREVYGPENPLWLIFRSWLLQDAPVWLRSLYIKHGAAFAIWIHDKPRIKSILRVCMDRAIRGYTYAT